MRTLNLYTLLIFTAITILGCSQTKPVAAVVTDEQPTTKPPLEFTVYVDNSFFQFQKTETGWNGIKSASTKSEKAATDYIQIEPTQGWEEFQMMLDYFNILNLPDQKDTKDYKPSPSSKISRNYSFTIYTNNSSRSFEYSNPEADLLRSWEAQSVVSFGTYLMNEFSEVK